MRRIVALDGLRVVAIGAVAAYHINDDLVPAGFWGVMLFFVLSGYLMTKLLTSDVEKHGRVRLGTFYARRAARMYSALLALVAAVWIAGAASGTSALASLSLTANYARIGGLDLGLFTHLWFLAVIGHFYLLWPLVINAITPENRSKIIGRLLVAAIAWRAFAIVFLDPGWVYNATDTNAAALLAGAYLAVAKPVRIPAKQWALPAMALLMLMPFFGVQGPGVFWGGFLAIALSVAVLQYALTNPNWLATPAMTWLGSVSYGIYLWHYVFIRAELNLALAIPATLLCAVVSCYLLEDPLRTWVVKHQRERSADPELINLAAGEPAPAKVPAKEPALAA